MEVLYFIAFFSLIIHTYDRARKAFSLLFPKEFMKIKDNIKNHAMFEYQHKVIVMLILSGETISMVPAALLAILVR